MDYLAGSQLLSWGVFLLHCMSCSFPTLFQFIHDNRRLTSKWHLTLNYFSCLYYTACFGRLRDEILNMLVTNAWHCYPTMSLFEKVLWDVITALLHKLLSLSELFVASLFQPSSASSELASRLTQFLTRIHRANTSLARIWPLHLTECLFYFPSIIHEIFSS